MKIKVQISCAVTVLLISDWIIALIMSLLSTSESSSFKSASMAVQCGLCGFKITEPDMALK